MRGVLLVAEDPRVVRSKAAILTAAVTVMAERGVAATTIEAIADTSGVAKTTIYRHWPERAELIVDAIESLLVSPRDPDTGSLATDLAMLATGLARGLGSQPWSKILPSFVDAAERDARLSEVHARFASKRDDLVRAVVQRARGRGEVRSDLSDDEVIELVAGPLFYQRMIRHQVPTKAQAERMAHLVARLARGDCID